MAVNTAEALGRDGEDAIGHATRMPCQGSRRVRVVRAKAALESTSRYLARDLGPEGIRVNLVSAGPLRTLAAKAIPGFEDLESMWSTRAPLGWDNVDQEPTARAVCALLSDLFPATTGEIVKDLTPGPWDSPVFQAAGASPDETRVGGAWRFGHMATAST